MFDVTPWKRAVRTPLNPLQPFKLYAKSLPIHQCVACEFASANAVHYDQFTAAIVARLKCFASKNIAFIYIKLHFIHFALTQGVKKPDPHGGLRLVGYCAGKGAYCCLRRRAARAARPAPSSSTLPGSGTSPSTGGNSAWPTSRSWFTVWIPQPLPVVIGQPLPPVR